MQHSMSYILVKRKGETMFLEEKKNIPVSLEGFSNLSMHKNKLSVLQGNKYYNEVCTILEKGEKFLSMDNKALTKNSESMLDYCIKIAIKILAFIAIGGLVGILIAGILAGLISILMVAFLSLLLAAAILIPPIAIITLLYKLKQILLKIDKKAPSSAINLHVDIKKTLNIINKINKKK